VPKRAAQPFNQPDCLRQPVISNVRRFMTSTTFVLVAAAVVVAAIFFMRQAKPPELSGDAQVVAQLRKAGSDLSKPHPVEFFMYFPSEIGAKHVSDKLNSIGFNAETKPAASGNLPWLTLATRSMVPEVAELERLRTVLSELSASEQGTYDGWGTPIVK